jgi:farnesyl diphosphate synthase
LSERADPNVCAAFGNLVKFTTLGGKQARGASAGSAFLELTNCDPESVEARIGYTIGWSLEVLQAGCLVADDLMDQSDTRRGKPCWYLTPGVGTRAVSDAMVLINLALVILESLRGQLPEDVVDELYFRMKEGNLRTIVGQTYDYKAIEHSFEAYRMVVIHKTAYYTIWMPFVLAIIASQKFVGQDWLTPEYSDFLLRMGYLFQAQDDFIDVFGDPNITGKHGTDIRDGKVTWLSCKAFELASPSDTAILRDGMGRDEAKVKEVYERLGIRSVFEEWQAAEIAQLQEQLSALDPAYPNKTAQVVLTALTGRSGRK